MNIRDKIKVKYARKMAIVDKLFKIENYIEDVFLYDTIPDRVVLVGGKEIMDLLADFPYTITVTTVTENGAYMQIEASYQDLNITFLIYVREYDSKRVSS